MWPTDVMSVDEVNDEGVLLDTTVNMRLSRIWGLVACSKGVINPARIR
jgi:hypothetical protein